MYLQKGDKVIAIFGQLSLKLHRTYEVIKASKTKAVLDSGDIIRNSDKRYKGSLVNAKYTITINDIEAIRFERYKQLKHDEFTFFAYSEQLLNTIS